MAAERSLHRPLKLMTIGTLAGLFSGLFGVGGGSADRDMATAAPAGSRDRAGLRGAARGERG
ncbi:MAG: hypothetical protein ABR992_02470 [Solirubrobacteraceae bacterium]